MDTYRRDLTNLDLFEREIPFDLGDLSARDDTDLYTRDFFETELSERDLELFERGAATPMFVFFFAFFLFRFCVDAPIYFVVGNLAQEGPRPHPRPRRLLKKSGTLPTTLTSSSAILRTRTFSSATLKSSKLVRVSGRRSGKSSTHSSIIQSTKF